MRGDLHAYSRARLERDHDGVDQRKRAGTELRFVSTKRDLLTKHDLITVPPRERRGGIGQRWYLPRRIRFGFVRRNVIRRDHVVIHITAHVLRDRRRRARRRRAATAKEREGPEHNDPCG